MAESSLMKGGRRNVPIHILSFLSRKILCVCSRLTFQKAILTGISLIFVRALSRHVQKPRNHIIKLMGRGKCLNKSDNEELHSVLVFLFDHKEHRILR